jgi:preprotein translocase SecE subunit
MAVAVKNAPEVGSPSPLERMQVVSLLGTLYLIACLGVVFKLIPTLWGTPGSAVSGAFLTLVMLAAVVGLAILGGRLLGPNPPKGVRAGIFVGFTGVLLVLLLTRWVSTLFEGWVYDNGWFAASGVTVGATLTAAIGALMLFFFIRWFLAPAREKMLIGFENQGWFSTTSYKPLQGQRVRRGTIIGLLVLFGCGIYTLISHGTLSRGADNWDLNIPFTGVAVVDLDNKESGDFASLYRREQPGATGKVRIDRKVFKALNDQLNPKDYVRMYMPNDPKGEPSYGKGFEDGQFVSRKDFEDRVRDRKNLDVLQQKDPELWKRLVDEGVAPLPPNYDERKDFQEPSPAKADISYSTITLLPAVRYSLPLVLAALSLWFAWRVVNVPGFADFLIATEAELNKVSWTTRKRLYQDTIVVLVTVLLMAVYLFFMDQVWRILLTFLRVLQFSDEGGPGSSATDLW